MPSIYIFIGDQVTEYQEWPDHTLAPIGCFSFEPVSDPDSRWGMLKTPTQSHPYEYNFISEFDVPELVPAQYRALALLLT